MVRSLSTALVVLLATFSPQAHAEDPEAVRQLRQQDVRLAKVAERIMSANDRLCRTHMPLTGMILHSRDQYGPEMAPAFTHGNLAVSGVVPGSSASTRLQADDTILAIGSTEIAGLKPEGKAPLRDAAFEALAEQPGTGPVRLRVSSGGTIAKMSLAAMSGCRALVEIRAADTLAARSDGRVIQINYALASAANDDQLAVAFAHELAHVVLEHRRRLATAGVDKGFFGEFGRNQKYNRQVEVEADRMSVHLLANAGYDPQLAPAFWRSELGGRIGGGLLKISATYPPPGARAAILETEIAQYLPAGGPSWPGHLLSRRDQPFR